MKHLIFANALIALTFIVPHPADAAYNPAIVAADARWVVYADLDGLRTTVLGRELVSAVEKAQSQATDGFIGIDVPKLLTTIGSMTAYGTNLANKASAIDGALVAQGTADLRKIAESLLLQGTLAQPEVFSEVKDLPFPAYAIADPKAKGDEKLNLLVAFPPEPIVLVSKSKAHLLKARDVFRGAAPSLAKVPASPLGKLALNANGAFLFAASVVPTEPIFPKNAPQARLLQLVNSSAIALGERGPHTFAHAELLASSEDNAEKLMKILQGMTSMLSLAETNDRQLADFLNSTSVSREKNTVILDLSYASARLVQMVQMVRAQADGKPVSRPQAITSGKAIAEWTAEEAAAPEGTPPNALAWRTIENVKLTNGATVTVGRSLNGGKHARFDRVEIVPADGGSPLTFRSEFMRASGNRGSMSQFQFPGADGIYVLKVAYVNDPDGKARFAVSVRDPQPPKPAETAESKPQSK